MTESLSQHIAGVDYLVSTPPEIRGVTLHASQRCFVSTCASSAEAIRVTLVAGDMPVLDWWRPLITHGSGWSIRRSGSQRCLSTGDLAAIPRNGLVVCWSDGVSQAHVHCGPEWLTVEPGGTTLHFSAGYPVDQILFMYYLASRQGLLIHAAGLVRDGRALLFPGVSGAGKSTLSRQFLAAGDPGLLSDDRIIVRWLDGAWQAFGTPWPGDAGIAVNAGAPLGAILFPAKAGETSIRALSPQEALDRLLPATSILWHEPELLTDQLATTERLLREIPAFELAWSLEKGVVDNVREFVARL